MTDTCEYLPEILVWFFMLFEIMIEYIAIRMYYTDWLRERDWYGMHPNITSILYWVLGIGLMVFTGWAFYHQPFFIAFISLGLMMWLMMIWGEDETT